MLFGIHTTHLHQNLMPPVRLTSSPVRAPSPTPEDSGKNREQNKRKQQEWSEQKTEVASVLRLSLSCLLEFGRLAYPI